jgi:Uncharacterized conserved protein
MTPEADSFTLDNFEGPLDLLWHLVNKQEIDIYQISLLDITKQYLAKIATSTFQNLDRGAEFIAMAAALVCFKSKALLPKHEQVQEDTYDHEADPRFEIIHHLLDYCRFKEAAKELSEREQQQGAFYPRGVDAGVAKKNLGIDHLSLDDLASLFQQILAKATHKQGTIHEEEWKVSDKIKVLKQLLNKSQRLLFFDVFNSNMSRIELIVTFLALLEMMKSGDARVANDKEKNTVCIYATS